MHTWVISVLMFVMVFCMSVNRLVGSELYTATAGVRALMNVLTSGTESTLVLTLLNEACSVCRHITTFQAAMQITAGWDPSTSGP